MNNYLLLFKIVKYFDILYALEIFYISAELKIITQINTQKYHSNQIVMFIYFK